jgi:hypothetical protein
MRGFFIALTRNPLSLAGSAITTASGVLTLTLFSIEMLGYHGSPYIGILAYLILPFVFVIGLLLIPWGIARERKRARRAVERGEPPPLFPVIDLNRSHVRGRLLVFLALSLVNVVILSTATYKGVEVMDSTTFCGTTCHSVMHPEYTAYQRSPHARVSCVSCHIGPGANWFVKSKLSGAWQVVATTFDLYPRPIPTPVENLRPARETCEQCHWPTQFIGDTLKVLPRYQNDEANTETHTVLLLRVGGRLGAESQGIHWHVDPANRIRYRADASRETIHEVELRLADGSVHTYTRGSAPPEATAAAEAWRVMDCVDCHNRPTHVYYSPGEEVDRALAERKLDAGLPFLRREALRALAGSYASHGEARREIARAIREFYEREHPQVLAQRADALAEAGRVLGDLYCSNVFPEMGVTWGTYPNHLGHEQSDGCFRCHDDALKSAEGRVISQDCFGCHALLAVEEREPEILAQLRP